MLNENAKKTMSEIFMVDRMMKKRANNNTNTQE